MSTATSTACGRHKQQPIYDERPRGSRRAVFFCPALRILMAKGWDGMKRKHSKNVGAEGRKEGRRGIFLRRGAMECKSAVSQNWPTALLLFMV